MIPENLYTKDDVVDILELKEKAKHMFQSVLPAMMAEHAILAGGCFSSWYHKEAPKDYDVFFIKTPEAEAWFNDWFIPHFITVPKDPVLKQSWMGTYPSDIIEIWNHPRINTQYIFTNYKTREELIESFDLVHSKVSYDGLGKKLYISKQTIDAIKNKVLIPTGKQQLLSKTRMNKFILNGWKEKWAVMPGLRSSDALTPSTPYINTTSKTLYDTSYYDNLVKSIA